MKQRAVLWSSIWLVIVLAVVCAAAKQCIRVSLLVPIILGLGIPAALLMALRQRRLRDMLNTDKP